MNEFQIIKIFISYLKTNVKKLVFHVADHDLGPLIYCLLFMYRN